MSAGLATLKLLDDALYQKLERLGAQLEEGLRAGARAAGLTACVQRLGSMITIFFSEGPVRSFADATKGGNERFARFHRGLIERGIYWPPSRFEAAFLSGAHDEADIHKTVQAARAALEEVARPPA